jgi:hypothetical protein
MRCLPPLLSVSFPAEVHRSPVRCSEEMLGVFSAFEFVVKRGIFAQSFIGHNIRIQFERMCAYLFPTALYKLIAGGSCTSVD